jgi:hypothetical protein
MHLIICIFICLYVIFLCTYMPPSYVCSVWLFLLIYLFWGVSAAICHNIHVNSEIWGCMCQRMCCSYASYSYWYTYPITKSSKQKFITKLFKGTQIKVAFCTQNTIQNTLKHHIQTDKYNNSGTCQMKCLDCPLKYIRQTGRTFSIQHKEHIHTIINNSSNSGYSNHMLNTEHT